MKTLKWCEVCQATTTHEEEQDLDLIFRPECLICGNPINSI